MSGCKLAGNARKSTAIKRFGSTLDEVHMEDKFSALSSFCTSTETFRVGDGGKNKTDLH